MTDRILIVDINILLYFQLIVQPNTRTQTISHDNKVS